MRNFSDEYFEDRNKRILNDSFFTFNESLKSLEGADVIINYKDKTRAYITNTYNEYADDAEYRAISVSENIDLKKGDLIKYENKDWLIRSDVDDHFSHKRAKMVKCNQYLHSLEFPFPIPMYANDTSYGQKGINAVTYFYIVDGQVLGLTNDNKYTRAIPDGYRFCYDGTKNKRNPEVYIVAKNEIITTTLRRISLKKTQCDPRDDLDNNIAYNTLRIFPDNEEVLNIDDYYIKSDNNRDKLRYGMEENYYLCNKNGDKVTCNIETNIGKENLGNNVQVVNLNADSITVRNIKGDCNSKLKLYFSIGENEYEKDIELVYR